MYTATMHYKFNQANFDEACTIWEKEILTHARNQKGCVRMQLLADHKKSEAMAIGTWKKPEDAAAFMQTGIFKKLMEKIRPFLVEDPVPHVWELLYFEEI
ncbi:MAG: hypothetical protein RBT69_11050 [Spirochaetia bacterium]|jgi:quinol monooxygenase YgiN|nr:hypothetical protein [Spirochaetia bacterium]